MNGVKSDAGELRTESDSLGSIELPAGALYGAQTQRAIENFPLSGRTMPEGFVRALLLLKRAAATANQNLERLDESEATAIRLAVDQLLDDPQLMRHFPVDVYQTGSGTSSNMNANEVVARLAHQLSRCAVHPNDHVNFGQSSNDVVPSCIHISALMALREQLMPALDGLRDAITQRADELGDIVKTGRTHLMDAMPLRFDQSLGAWTGQLGSARKRLVALEPSLATLAIGGTAVGTGINTDPRFAKTVCDALQERTGLPFRCSDNPAMLMSAQDTAVALSGELRTLATALMKICNDLRWMNSGPLSGLGEITLPILQPGSSIMPGKVNPVIPEAVAMICARVSGNDTTIMIGGQSGNFELNVMLPVIADAVLESITLLAAGMNALTEKAIRGFSVNTDNIHAGLQRNPILVTALNPVIGYAKAAAIAKKAYAEKRSIIDVAAEETDLPKDELLTLLNPAKLTEGGLS
ncbi:MAG: class II fumarate hydratase [Pseudomonadota bacterium]